MAEAVLELTAVYEKDENLPNDDHSLDMLTKRQREIFTLIGEDLSNDDIAARLSISKKTVDTNLNMIRQRLKFESMFDLRKFAQSID